MMLYRPDYYKGEKEDGEPVPEEQVDVNKAEVIVAKNRHGETGTVEFAFDGEHTLFVPLERVHDD
jgi:replicative DNA helicase